MEEEQSAEIKKQPEFFEVKPHFEWVDFRRSYTQIAMYREPIDQAVILYHAQKLMEEGQR